MFIKSAFHFNRNLINKTNKQAKYNQRHWNWEWADSDQRGEGKRLKGKGWRVCRNNYKGTWTITRGCEIWEGGGESWDRVECWGEKAGNYTWTTIKKFVKKMIIPPWRVLFIFWYTHTVFSFGYAINKRIA